MTKDSVGRELTPGQRRYFADSKAVDSSGNLLVCYHGTPHPGFTEFSPTKERSAFGTDYGGSVNFFASTKAAAKGYTELGVERDGNIYEVYLDIRKPFEVDVDYRGYIRSEELSEYADGIFDDAFLGLANRIDGGDDVPLDEINSILRPCGIAIKPNAENPEYYDVCHADASTAFSGSPFAYQYTLEEIFDDADLYEEIKAEATGREAFSPNDVVSLVQRSNADGRTDYDGIIIRNISLKGPKGGMFDGDSDMLVTLKSPNQIKSVGNIDPTPSNRIDEDSLSEGGHMNGGFSQSDFIYE